MAEWVPSVVEMIQELPGRFAPDRYLINQWVDIAVAATLFTALVLPLLKLGGCWRGVRGARRRMTADLYQLLLYRRSARAVLSAELRLVAHNAMLAAFLAPTAAGAAALYGAVGGALHDRYAYGPVRVGETFVARVVSGAPRNASLPSFGGAPATGKFVVSARVGVPSRRTVWLRAAGREAGVHDFYLPPGGPVVARINVQDPRAPALPQYKSGEFQVVISYPRFRDWTLPGGWRACFLLCSLLAGAVVAPLYGIRL
jgi:hypothetical protein